MLHQFRKEVQRGEALGPWFVHLCGPVPAEHYHIGKTDMSSTRFWTVGKLGVVEYINV